MKRHTHAVTLYNFDTELYLLRSIKFNLTLISFNLRSISHFKLAVVKFEINKAHVLSSCGKTCSTSNEF